MLAAKVGDEVQVTFTGKVRRVEDFGSLSECLVVESSASGFEHAIYESASQDVTVTKAAGPENWPVQENDVWKCGSYTYHVIGGRMVRTRIGSVYTVSRSPEELRTSDVTMTLLYRHFK